MPEFTAEERAAWREILQAEVAQDPAGLMARQILARLLENVGDAYEWCDCRFHNDLLDRQLHKLWSSRTA